jgi:hypothetical protein
MWRLWFVALLGCGLSMGWVRAANAETVWVEAEAAVVASEATQTPPLLIHDREDASGGSFIEVAPGNNSTGGPPSTGIASYRVFIGAPGAFHIWGRVIAPDNASDSFWVRVNGGSWLSWNGMRSGDTWHWVPVRAQNTHQPADFQLVGGDYNLVQVAYREDGTQLDALVISDEPGFDPAAVAPGPPRAPRLARLTRGRGAIRVNWAVVEGAASYTLKRQKAGETSFTTVASGVTGFTFTDAGLPLSTDGTCYQIFAVNAAGVAGHPRVDCQVTDAVFEDWFPLHASITAPMLLTPAGNLTVKRGSNSLNAPPATGRGIFRFQTPVSTQVKVWASVVAPGVAADSFWVRMDGANWVRWNGIKPSRCRGYDVVRDSNQGNQPVVFPLGPGTHTLEVAYREEGAELARLVVRDELQDLPPCDR